MGSVIETIECPNCKLDAWSDFYYKTGEEYVNCSHCGYYYTATIKNRDKYLTDLTDEDWEIKEIKQPYGAFRYQMAGEIVITSGTLSNEQEAEDFRVAMKLEYKDHVDFATITRVIDGVEQIEQVVEPTSNQ